MPMPQLMRFPVVHLGNGIALGLICAESLLVADILQIGSLLAADGGALAMLLFFARAALIFGPANMGVAVMNLR
jgi:hypothetical protein